jgi:LysR family transcriptional regulator for metE and metH
LDRGYVAHRPVRRNGLHATLFAATTEALAETAYMAEFIETMREVSFEQLQGIEAAG